MIKRTRSTTLLGEAEKSWPVSIESSENTEQYWIRQWGFLSNASSDSAKWQRPRSGISTLLLCN